MICDKCNHKNPQEAKFCESCGAQIDTDNVTNTVKLPKAPQETSLGLSTDKQYDSYVKKREIPFGSILICIMGLFLGALVLRSIVDFFAILLLIALFSFVIGMISPKLIYTPRMTSRKYVVALYIPLIMLSFVGLGISSESRSGSAQNDSSKNQKVSNKGKSPSKIKPALETSKAKSQTGKPERSDSTAKNPDKNKQEVTDKASISLIDSQAIQHVKDHVTPSGKTVNKMLSIKYSDGSWYSYKPGGFSTCPISAEQQYADWIVCFKTTLTASGKSFSKEPTWRIHKGKVYPLNGTASEITGETIPPITGHADHTSGKHSKTDEPPTNYECKVSVAVLNALMEFDSKIPENVYLKMSEEEAVELIDRPALKKVAKNYKLSVDEVQAIHDKVGLAQARSTNIVCPH